jgi:hypothetical protein
VRIITPLCRSRLNITRYDISSFTMPSVTYEVLPIQVNNQCISYTEWVSLFTICLAPLIAHIVSGTPPASYLVHTRPRWYDHLCHYNPTSILWRYAAITDRRIRATRWARSDLAASNAIFWTSKGWDGGEHMVSETSPYCLRYPETTHVQIVSTTMLKTIITTLQGVAAIYSLIGTISGTADLEPIGRMGVDMVFYPLSVLGLLRLCAATWLTEDFLFHSKNDVSSKASWSRLSPLAIDDHGIPSTELQEALDPFLITPFEQNVRFKHPRISRRSRLFRTFYLVILLGLWGLSFIYLSPGFPEKFIQFTATGFLVALFYFLLLTFSITLYAFYFYHGQTTTTVIPCSSRMWYKLYTLILISYMFVLVIVAAIETNKVPDGYYSSLSVLSGIECSSSRSWWLFPPNSTFYGFAWHVEKNYSKPSTMNYSTIVAKEIYGNSSFSEEEFEYRLYNFTGYCVGQVKNMTTQH